MLGGSYHTIVSNEKEKKMGRDALACQNILRDRVTLRFVGDTKQGDHVLVLRLADKLRKDTDVVEGALSERR